MEGNGKHESIIKQFVKQWRNGEHDQYSSLTEGARKLFDQKFCKKPPGPFSIAFVKCLIMARAKSCDTIEDTINRRENDRKMFKSGGTIVDLGPFTNTEQIRTAMPDLAGIRIILVFPDDDVKIHDFITKNTIAVDIPKYWGINENGSLRVNQFTDIRNKNNRFVGYRAIHYRVRLQEEIADESNLADGSESLKSWWRKQWDQSWGGRHIEIQVTSMTMYAWQEVHHDLIYKTYEGQLTEDEIRSLDMVNGLVHANEIALNQFHQSLNKRLDNNRRKFRDVSHLRNWIIAHLQESLHPSFKDSLPPMNFVEPLFYVLEVYELETPEKLLGEITETTKQATGEATGEPTGEPDEESIEEALVSIKTWRLDLEQRLKAGCNHNGDASAWILLKICERKSPFKTKVSEYERDRKEFLTVAHLVMDMVLGTGETIPWVNIFTQKLPKIVRQESTLGQIMLRTGQKVKDKPSGCEEYGTWNDLRRMTKPVSKIYIYDSALVRSAVSLALVLLGVSVVPSPAGLEGWNFHWSERDNHFWPGILSIEHCADDFSKPFHNVRTSKSEGRQSGWLLCIESNRWRTLYFHGNHDFANPEWEYVQTGIPEDFVESLNLAIVKMGLDLVHDTAPDTNPNIDPAIDLDTDSEECPSLVEVDT